MHRWLGFGGGGDPSLDLLEVFQPKVGTQWGGSELSAPPATVLRAVGLQGGRAEKPFGAIQGPDFTDLFPPFGTIWEVDLRVRAFLLV